MIPLTVAPTPTIVVPHNNPHPPSPPADGHPDPHDPAHPDAGADAHANDDPAVPPGPFPRDTGI
jgi:hypothetical protein